MNFSSWLNSLTRSEKIIKPNSLFDALVRKEAKQAFCEEEEIIKCSSIKLSLPIPNGL